MAASSGAIIRLPAAHCGQEASTEFPGLLTIKTPCVSIVISVLLLMLPPKSFAALG
jgi:hypothetical protein